MKPRKRKLTREELSLVRSAAGRKGAFVTVARGHCRGGRPKGSGVKDPASVAATRSMYVRECDYQVFQRCAFAAQTSLVDMMHLVAEGLKARNPAIFRSGDLADGGVEA